jgi:heterodisulfide reductase subunit A-like polyferredoxin
MDYSPGARDAELEPIRKKRALVNGGGIAGIQAATDVAAQGFPVTIVERGSRLGGRLAEPNLKYL